MRKLTPDEISRRVAALRDAGGSVVAAARVLGLSEYGLTIWRDRTLAASPELFADVPRPEYQEDTEGRMEAAAAALRATQGRRRPAWKRLGWSSTTLDHWLARARVERPELLDGIPEPRPGRPWPRVDDEARLAALEAAGGNLRAAARALGITHQGLAYWIAQRRATAQPPALDVAARYAALDAAGGNISTAARQLGMTRQALHDWLRRNPRPK